jgi:pyridoxamine 5'-phosphate oxidase
MTKTEIIKFINENLVCQLATAENAQPHVRNLLAYKADENGIIFHTGPNKDFYQQIKNNPLVEACFYNQTSRIQVRVKGRAVFVEDQKLKEEIVANRSFLKPWVEKQGYKTLIVFQVTECVAHTWTFETNFSPKEYIKF